MPPTARPHRPPRLVGAVALLGVLLSAGCTINLPGAARGGSDGPTTQASPAAVASASPSPSAPVATPSPSAATLSWEQVFAQDAGSVVRITTASCDDGTYAASGFAVGPNLVMTAAHVVDGMRVVTVQTPKGDLVRAHVLGYAMNADTALLRTDDDLGATPLPISTAPLAGGADLAVLGYPLGVTDVRIVNGIVSSTDDSVDYPGQHVEHVFTTNASTNGGNSGGPVVDRTGAVIGLVSGGTSWDSEQRPVTGINYVVPPNVLQAKLEAWRGKTPRQPRCEGDVTAPTSSDDLNVTVESTQADAGDIAQSLYLHGESINVGSYATAWSVFTPANQARLGGESGWASGLNTSFWTDLDVTQVSRSGSTAVARATLQTRQDAEYGHDGQTCSVWSMRYTMKLVDGIWLIDRVRPSGSPTAC